jgi:signal transduction histidine kinase
MMRLRPRTALALLLILGISGLALLITGSVLRAQASAHLFAATSAIVSRIREMDRIAMADPRRNAQAIADLDDALRQSVEPGEEEVLSRARACLAGASGCPPDSAGALEPVRQYYSERLQQRWAGTQRRRQLATWLASIGFLCCAAGLVSGSVALFRAGAEGPASPERAMVEQTMRRRLEELYAARLHAWQSDRFAAVGEIAAGLSHGLKTPLAGIRAAAQLAQAKIGDGHPAARQLEDIIGETDSLTEQIRRFLGASSAARPTPSPVSAAHVLEALERQYGSRAAERGLRWRTEVALGVPDICVDPALLEMACRNLVENALAAAPPGSTVSVLARAAEPPVRAGLEEAPPTSGRWMEIAVCDEGPGIPAQVGAGAAMSSQKPGGSGLGVAIARRIVERHGGALVFESGAGTTARVLLPAAEAE